jgi:hypothetical protein
LLELLLEALAFLFLSAAAFALRLLADFDDFARRLASAAHATRRDRLPEWTSLGAT